MPFLEAGRFVHGRFSPGRNMLLEISAQLTATGSAPGFLTFVSGYTVFVGPIIGIIVTDVYSLFTRVISTVRA